MGQLGMEIDRETEMGQLGMEIDRDGTVRYGDRERWDS